ncbi:hypothetical protein ACFL5L_04305, partial [candidate division KSB1 bacterium]
MLTQSGYTVSAACDALGVSRSSYYGVSHPSRDRSAGGRFASGGKAPCVSDKTDRDFALLEKI